MSAEDLRKMFERRLRRTKVVVRKGCLPSREEVDSSESIVWVTLDAGGVVGRVVIDNALSHAEEQAMLRWVDEGWDGNYWRQYQGRGIDFGPRADARGTVERVDVATVPYKLEGETDVMATVFDVGMELAQAILEVVSNRVHQVLDKALASPEGADEDRLASPSGEPSPAALAHDRDRGCEDPPRIRLAALAEHLLKTWREPQALQVTRYHADKLSSLAQHFDSRACYGAIATASLRYACTLVMVRQHGRFRQVSEVELHPRSIYVLTGPARGDCTDPDDATRNHKRCPCCWTHGIQIDTDDDFRSRFDNSAEERRRVGLTIRSLTPATVVRATSDWERVQEVKRRRLEY